MEQTPPAAIREIEIFERKLRDWLSENSQGPTKIGLISALFIHLYGENLDQELVRQVLDRSAQAPEEPITPGSPAV